MQAYGQARSYTQSYSYYTRDELHALLGGGYSKDVDRLYVEHGQIFVSGCQGDAVNQRCNTDLQMFMVA